MKELIVIVGSVMLGCLLFDMIAGEENSLRSAAGTQMEHYVELYGEE